MQETYKDKFPTIVFKQMDARQLNFDDGQFDVIIDKACFDAVLCGDNTGPNSEAFLNEAHRVLNPTGIYINVSYGIPE